MAGHKENSWRINSLWVVLSPIASALPAARLVRGGRPPTLRVPSLKISLQAISNALLGLRKMNFPKMPECFSNDPRLLKDNVGEDRLLLPNGNRMHPDFGFYLKIAPTPRLTANRSRGLCV
jgi:hypothetical protein